MSQTQVSVRVNLSLRERAMSTFLALTAIVFLVLLCSGFTQKRKRPATTAIPEHTQPSFATLAVDPETHKLPPNYKGHDISAVYTALQRKLEPKGEFESSAQYKARLNNAASVISDYLYAFKIGNSVTTTHFDSARLFTYDADREIMDLSLPYESYADFGGPAILTRSDLRIESSHHTNRFGAVVEDLTSVYVNFYVVLQQKALPDDYTGSTQLNILRNKAQALKSVLGVLLVGRITPDSQSRLIIPGTGIGIGSPGTEFIQHGLSFDLQQVWIYNTQSGEILKRIKL